MAKHLGSFAGGFAKSFTEMMKLYLMQQHYEALKKHYDAQEALWAQRGQGKGFPAGTYEAGAAAGRAWDTGGGASTAKIDPNAASIVAKELTDRGVKPEVAAGAVAGMMGESGAKLDPTAFNTKDPGGGAGGIAQWNRERLVGPNGMLAYAKSRGIDVNPNVPQDSKKVPFQVQADFLGHELDTSHNSVLKGLQVANTGEEGLTTWVNNYEVPADKAGAIAQRRQYIQPVTATLRNPPKTTAPTTTNVAAPTAAPTKGPNKGKTPKTETTPAAPAKPTPAPDTVASRDGSYQVAGDTSIALTPEEAAKARADLEAHRASPDAAPPHVFTPDELGGEAQVSGRGPTEDPASAGAGSPPREPAPLPITPLSPKTQALHDVANYPPSTDYPQPGPAPPPPPQYGPPQRTGASPNVGSTPSSAPPPVMGPPQRTGAPPNVGSTPSSVPALPVESGYPEPDAAPRMPPRTTTPATAYPASAIYGPPTRADTGARPDLTARSPATDANVPSKDAQPVSATRAIPSNPAGNSPGFVQVTAPNSDPTARNRPQMTALDLSHLWGPNPPLPPKQAPVASAPAPRPQDQDFAVGSPDMDNAALGADIMGSAKGGPIRRYAQGGAIPTRPVMGLATGGATSGSVVTEPYVNQTAVVPGYTYNPTVSSGANLRLEQNQALYGTTSPGVSADFGSAWAKLTPDQQNWYTQSAIAGNYNQANANPYPATPAPTPAAPASAPAPTPAPVTPPTATTIVSPAATTTVTDPTTTTTTGAPGLPNSVTAKSYDPNVDQQTGASFANTSSAGGTDYSVGSDDTLKKNASGQISGSRKGGPIRRYANGGGIPSRPTMRLAAGGGAAASSLLSPNYSGPMAGGGWAGTPYADMAPNQQTWATNQQNLLAQEKANANNPAWSGWAQLSGTPEAIWPSAPAPAAPTPLNEPAPTVSNTVSPSAASTISDPTTTTTTGAPGLPNSIQAKSYDPNVDAQTGAGFANTSNTGGTDYSVGADDLLQQNASGQISGTNQNNTTILSRKGGPITRRVNRYDDGGGVSPSAAGMPPGLGGQQAIPPIYFNPATYAGAGAPVGKGITQNSATTFNAGAIPSLPMARGGVVAFDDGGVADPDTSVEDMQVSRDDDAINQSLTQGDTSAAGAPVSYFTPADVMQPPAAPTAQGGPPSNASPMTTEISDGQGNPSKGLIAAIGDGLHWLGDHLGLVGGAQAHPAIASDPQTQDNRSGFAQGRNVGGMDHDIHKQIATTFDPNGTLNDAERNIAVMEGSYRFLLSQGDTQNASKMAASILQYSVQTSQKFAEEAAKQLYDGNLQGAADAINHASDAIPDGRLTHVTLNNDGTAIVTAKGMDGRTLWQQRGSAEAILQYATNRGRTGQMQWDALEGQAAKYDPTFRDMAHNRLLNANAQAKEDAANASAERVASAVGDTTLKPVTRTGNTAPSPALPGPGAPAAASPSPATPSPTPVSAPTTGAPTSPDSTGTAAPSAPPAEADSNQPTIIGVGSGQAGLSDQPAPGPAIPTTATVDQPITLKDVTQAPAPAAPTAPSPNAPAAEAQPVSFEDITRRIDNQETQVNNSDAAHIRASYFTPEGNVIVNGQEYARPPLPNMTGLKPAEQRQAVQDYEKGPLAQYNAMLKANQDAMNKDIADNRDLRSKQFQTLRDQAGRQFTESQANIRSQRKIDADATLEKNRQADTERKQQETWTHEQQKPLPPDEGTKRFAEHSATSYLASSPATAVYKSDGTLDENASSQALGRMFDLNDRGGLRRVDTLSTALTNTQTYNPHVSPQQLGTTLTNMANGAYGYRAKTQPVDYGYGPMRQVEVFRGKVGQGTPTRLLIPADDYDAVDGIKGEWVAAHKPPPAPSTAPDAPTTPTAPAIPTTPFKPLVSGPMLRTPNWVSPEQIPPEQRRLYPELNQ